MFRSEYNVAHFFAFANIFLKKKRFFITSDLAGKLSKRQRVTDSLDREIGEDGATRGDFIDDRSTESADAAVISAETAEALKTWAATLTDQQRAILAGLQEGKSQTQIAEELGCTKQNVGKIVRRLRAAAEAAVRQGDPLFQSEKTETDEILHGLAARGLRFDRGSIAAVRQSLEHNIASLSEKVKTCLLNAFDSCSSGKPLPGLMRAMDVRGFVTAMESLGFVRSGSSSAYLTENGNTVRLSYHDASAKTFKEHGVKGNIVSISIRKETQSSKSFRSDPDVDMVEYVFPLSDMNNGKLAVLIYDMGNFFATGKYTDGSRNGKRFKHRLP